VAIIIHNKKNFKGGGNYYECCKKSDYERGLGKANAAQLLTLIPTASKP
jgi:hypothetical protein